MQSSTTDPRCGWRRAKGGEVAHFWRVNFVDGALVSLCNIHHGQGDRRELEGPAICPVCREGLRRAHLVASFLETHIHLDAEGGGQHLQVEPWYWWGVVLPIYGTLNYDAEGSLRRVYTRAYVGVPRWHIKSTSAAGLGLYHLTMEPMVGTELYAVATSLGQAGAIFRKARRMAVSDEVLSAALYSPRSIIECRETGATFKALPHDADTAQGFHPQFAAKYILTEAHMATERGRFIFQSTVTPEGPEGHFKGVATSTRTTKDGKSFFSEKALASMQAQCPLRLVEGSGGQLPLPALSPGSSARRSRRTSSGRIRRGSGSVSGSPPS